MAGPRAIPMLFALVILFGCTGAERGTPLPTTPGSDTFQEPLPTAATSTRSPSTTPLPAESESAVAGSTENGPAGSEETETDAGTAAPDASIGDAEESSAKSDGAPDGQDVNRQPRAPNFGTGRAPQWPFSGLIQLWLEADMSDPDLSEPRWFIRYWHWPSTGTADSAVWLPGFDTDCLGQTAVAVHGADGIEIGATDGTNPSTYWIPWFDGAQATEQPTEQLTSEVAVRPSNIDARTKGDLLYLTVGEQSQTYALRQHVRPDGQRWIAQARHDGDVLIITVHPRHLPCFSGVTWLSDARNGELLGCGTSTHVVRFISPTPPPHDDLVLPDPKAFGTYLSCAPSLDFSEVDLPSR